MEVNLAGKRLNSVGTLLEGLVEVAEVVMLVELAGDILVSA
jgi:hypothetical protein